MAAVDVVFRPEFREALGLLGKAVENMRRRGLTSPILVGGAAVEFYTGGAVTTGDFDCDANLATVEGWAREEDFS